jgi:hypothetical protein
MPRFRLSTGYFYSRFQSLLYLITRTDLEQGGLHALIRVALLVKRPPPLRP